MKLTVIHMPTEVFIPDIVDGDLDYKTTESWPRKFDGIMPVVTLMGAKKHLKVARVKGVVVKEDIFIACFHEDEHMLSAHWMNWAILEDKIHKMLTHTTYMHLVGPTDRNRIRRRLDNLVGPSLRCHLQNWGAERPVWEDTKPPKYPDRIWTAVALTTIKPELFESLPTIKHHKRGQSTDIWLGEQADPRRPIGGEPISVTHL